MSVLPAGFRHFMREVYGTEAADAWLQRLPALLAEWAERWQLEILPPFENLSFHYVAPAVRARGWLTMPSTASHGASATILAIPAPSL